MNYSANLIFARVSVIVSALLLFACEQSPKDIGFNFKKDRADTLGVNYSDNLIQLKSSTVLVDSVNTHDNLILLTGSYTDARFGKISASAYCQVSQFNSSVSFGNFPTYDSLKLILGYVSSYGDTTKYQTLRVYRLTDSVKNYTGITSTNVTGFPVYNSKSSGLPYENQELGSIRFKPGRFTRPNTFTYPGIVIQNTASSNTSRLDTMSIRLRDDVGRDIFTQALIGNLNDVNKFKSYFKGLALISSDEAAVVGFSAGGSSALRLYFHQPGDTVSSHYDFVIAPSTYNSGEKSEYYAHHYSRVIADRSATPINNLQSPFQTLPSASTNEETFVQSGIGIFTRIEFTNLEALKANKNIHINSAELLISPTVTFNGSYTPPPSGLLLYESASNGKLLAVQLSNGQIAYYTVVQEGGTSSQVAPYDKLNNLYRFNFTSYLQSLLSGRRDNYGVLLAPFSGITNGSVSRVTLGSPQSAVSKMKLRVYFTKLNN
jgi:hypothetical protein